LLFFLLISIAILQNGELSAVNRENKSRYIIETDNFIINFSENKENIAREVAGIAEEVHQNLSEFITHSPEDRTHIILNDNMDTVNASANPNYFNRINIYLRRPEIYTGMVGYYKSWLRLLITHEYAHILHLDMVKGEFKLFRQLFGRIPLISTPNILQPYWMIEGYAVYAETEYTAGGRGNNDIYSMFLRTAFSTDQVYRIDQIHGMYDLGQWLPGSRSVYIYGASIFDYIVDIYGEEKLVKISEEFSREPQRGINKIVERVLGIDLDRLYEDWKIQKERESFTLKSEIRDNRLTTPEKLTEHGWYTHNIAVSNAGDIAYFHYGNEFPAIRLLKAGETDRHLFQVMNPAGERISWAPDQDKIVYPGLKYIKSDTAFYDLFIYDVAHDRQQRITYEERAYSPVWKNQEQILFLSQQKGITDLKKVNLESGETKTLLKGSEEIQFSHLAIGPDKEKVLMSVWNEGKRDIYQYCLNNNELSPVIKDDHINVFPEFSPEGEYIIFSSDRNGIFNLYGYELQTGKLYQITNLYTGAFEARFKNDNELVFIGYSEDGFNIYNIKVEKDNWELVEDFKNQIDEQKIKLLNNTDLVSRKTDKQKAKYERSRRQWRKNTQKL